MSSYAVLLGKTVLCLLLVTAGGLRTAVAHHVDPGTRVAQRDELICPDASCAVSVAEQGPQAL